MIGRALVLGVVLGVVLGSASTAFADAQAEAVALFDQGIQDMKSGKYEKACKELAASNAKSPDSGTKGNLARCLAHTGHTASAWVLWRELADTAPSKELRADAAANAKKLEPKLARIAIKIVEEVPGLVVTINGGPTEALEIAMPVDPGKLAIVARAPGHREWSTETTAEEGKTSSIEIPALPPLVSAKPPDARDPDRDNNAHRRHSRHVAAVVVGGIGAAALIGGGLFGLRANSWWNDANTTCGGSVDHCPANRLEPARAQVNTARSSATLSTVMLGAGGVAAIAGIVLWVTAPKLGHETYAIAPMIAPSYSGLSVSGAF